MTGFWGGFAIGVVVAVWGVGVFWRFCFRFLRRHGWKIEMHEPRKPPPVNADEELRILRVAHALGVSPGVVRDCHRRAKERDGIKKPEGVDPPA